MSKSEILIEELAGQKRKLRLRGAGLPKRGANWAGKQRLVTTWYPGNLAQASQQILGPVEPPSSWNGEWNTTRLVRTPALYETTGGVSQLAFAHAVALAFEDILRMGALLQVTWLVDNENDFILPQQILRQGRASDWNFAYDRIDDIVWTVNWEWTGRGATQERVAFRSDGATESALNNLDLALIAANEAINNTTIQLSKRTIPQSANKFTLEQLGALLNAPNLLMKDFSQTCNRISNRVKAVGGLITTGANLPFEVTNQALDIATTAVQAANSFYDSCTQTPPDYLDMQQRLASLTRAASYYKTALDTSAEIQKRAADAAIAIQAGSSGGSAGAHRGGTGANGKGAASRTWLKPKNPSGQKSQMDVYLVMPGDTLIGISVRFYGTPDGAADIAFANNLPLRTAQPPVGRVLIIPPYKGLGDGLAGKRLPGIKPADGENPELPGGVGRLYPWAP